MEEYVLKSRLPRLYWCERTGVLEPLAAATIYTSYGDALDVKKAISDEDEDWTIVPLAEARREK